MAIPLSPSGNDDVIYEQQPLTHLCRNEWGPQGWPFLFENTSQTIPNPNFGSEIQPNLLSPFQSKFLAGTIFLVPFLRIFRFFQMYCGHMPNVTSHPSFSLFWQFYSKMTFIPRTHFKTWELYHEINSFYHQWKTFKNSTQDDFYHKIILLLSDNFLSFDNILAGAILSIN